jgi:hypothetical protein
MGLKFNCSNPACQQRIEVEDAMAGYFVPCPACGNNLQAPSSANVKLICANPECEQHIIVDAGEAGRFIRCPSCNKPMKVPGDPPKAFAPANVNRAKAKTDTFSVPNPSSNHGRFLKASDFSILIQNYLESRFPILKTTWGSRVRRLLMGWSAGTVLFGLFLSLLYIRAWAILPPHFSTVMNEVYFDGEFRGAPIVNHAESLLLYAQDVPEGVGIFLVDLKTLARTQLQVVTAADKAQIRPFKLFGWSSDDRYLAFAVAETNGENGRIILCDGANGKAESSIDVPNSIEQGIWISESGLILLDHLAKLQRMDIDKYENPDLHFLRQLENLDLTYSLVADSDHSVAYISNGNIWTLNLNDNQPFQLTHLAGADIDWLDYNPTTGRYLFCSKGTDDNNGGLFEFDPFGHGQNQLVQLEGGSPLKGQWIGNGSGFAFVRTIAGWNTLTIHTQDESIRTNLFGSHFGGNYGDVKSYSVSPRKDKVYAMGDVGNRDGLAIWEYDIAECKFRALTSGKHPAFYSQQIEPIRGMATNISGEVVDYYCWPPARFNSHKKYPVVMTQYSWGHYNQDFQTIANAGIFVVSQNHPGVDYFPGHPVNPSFDDTIAVYNAILKNPNVDSHRIYISGESGSTSTACGLVEAYPTLWRGLILLSPVYFPSMPDAQRRSPEIFISEGKQEQLELQAMCERTLTEADRNLVRARIVYSQGAHTFSSTEQLKQRYEAMVEFILSDP